MELLLALWVLLARAAPNCEQTWQPVDCEASLWLELVLFDVDSNVDSDLLMRLVPLVAREAGHCLIVNQVLLDGRSGYGGHQWRK